MNKKALISDQCKRQTTMRLIKKDATFFLILYSLNSTSLIVIYEHFKELQKIKNLPPVPSNPKNNRFPFIVYRGQILLKLF